MKIILKSLAGEERNISLELGFVDFDLGSVVVVVEDSDGDSVTYVPQTHERNQADQIKFLEERLRRVDAIANSERKRADHNYEKFCEARRTPLLDGMGVEMRGGEIIGITLANGLEFVPKPLYTGELEIVTTLRAEVESLNTQLAVARALAEDRLATIHRQAELLHSRDCKAGARSFG